MRVFATFTVHVNLVITKLMFVFLTSWSSKWPRGLRHVSAVACLLGLLFRIPTVACTSVSCECCVLSEFSASSWSLVQRIPDKCDREASIMWRSRPPRGCCVMGGGNNCNQLSRRRNGYLSRVSVVCCQLGALVSGLSLVQRSPIDCLVSECDREASIMRRFPSTCGFFSMEKKIVTN